MCDELGEIGLVSKLDKSGLEKKTPHLIAQLTDLAFCLDAFVMAGKMSGEYLNSFDTLSDIAKSAFTKAIIIEYATPFITNEKCKRVRSFIATF